MFELILYNLSSSGMLITIFLILLFLMGCSIYLLTRKFNLKDGKIKIYGLLLNIKSKDIFIFSIVTVRAFLIIYSVLVYQENINMCLMMIAIVSIMLIICSLNDIIYEIVNSLSLIAIVYFIHTLNNYIIEIDNTIPVQLIKIILILFAMLYTVYIWLRSFEDITTNNANIENESEV